MSLLFSKIPNICHSLLCNQLMKLTFLSASHTSSNLKASSDSALKTASLVSRLWKLDQLIFEFFRSLFADWLPVSITVAMAAFEPMYSAYLSMASLNEFFNSAIRASLSSTSLSIKNVVYVSCLASTFLHASFSSSKFTITISDPLSSSTDFVNSESFLVNRPFAAHLWFLASCSAIMSRFDKMRMRPYRGQVAGKFLVLHILR